MKKISKRTIGESLRISIKFPSNVSEYSAFSAVLKSTGSDGQKLASFDATNARVDALDLKKYWLDIEAPQTEKASAGEYSLAVAYTKADPNFDSGDVKKFEVVAFELVDRNTFAGINFDRPIEISIGSSEVIAVTITSEFGEAAACPVSSVNTKTGAVVLNADDIEPTASRGWFTTLLADTLSAVAQWITDMGIPHVTGKNNPHETSFLNVKGYPSNPEGKVLTDRGTFDYVSAGGATNLPLYASNTDSLASGYKVLKGSPDATEVVKTIIASAATGIVAGEAHLSATPIGISLIPAGTFEFGYWRAVDNSQGDSFKQVEVFTRSAAGAETSLFTLESSSIDDTGLTERVITRTISQSYAVNPAHFLGVRFKFRTTRATATTLSYIVGGARGWWMRTTLPLKHDDLSDKNGNPDFQHITTAEKTQGALATGSSALDTVKKVADKVVSLSYNKTIDISYTINTTGVTLIELSRDSNGTLLSECDLKKISLYFYLETNSDITGKRLAISVNNVTTATYKQTTSSGVYILGRIGASGFYRLDLVLLGDILYFRFTGSQSPTKVADATSVSITPLDGVNFTIDTIQTIQLFVLSSENCEFKGKIKIRGVYD